MASPQFTMQQSNVPHSFFQESLLEIIKYLRMMPLKLSQKFLVKSFSLNANLIDKSPYFKNLVQFYNYLCKNDHYHFPFIANEFIKRGIGKTQIISLGIAQTLSAKEFYFSDNSNLKKIFFYDLRRFDHNYPEFFKSEIWEDFDHNPEIIIPILTMKITETSYELIFSLKEDLIQSQTTKESLIVFLETVRSFSPQLANSAAIKRPTIFSSSDEQFESWEKNLKEAQNVFYGQELGNKFVFSKSISSILNDNHSIIPYWLSEVNLNWQLDLKETLHHSFIIINSKDSAFYSKTPEKLFSLEKEVLYMEALAGTIARDCDEDINKYLKTKLLNDPKERKEHQIVIDYFINSFQSQKLEIQRTEVLELNKIQHLYTPLSLYLNNLKLSDIFYLIEKLHPSPAICGSPKEAAFLIIKEFEKNDRGLYAGAITFGLWDFDFPQNSSVNSLVAIRSQLFKGQDYYIFAGAGIMENSNPQQEWLEINSKLESFSSVEF